MCCVTENIMETEDVQENCSDLVYFNSQRGHKKLYHQGYVYRKNRTIHQTTYWACQEKGFRCHGRLIVTDGKVTKKTKHSHWPDPCEAKVQITISRMVDNAKDDENVGTLEIVKNHLGKLDATYRPYLPSVVAVKRRLQRARKRSQRNGQFTLYDKQIIGEARGKISVAVFAFLREERIFTACPLQDCTPPGLYPPPGSYHPLQGRTPLQGHTPLEPQKRMVRIILECFLVYFYANYGIHV